MTSQNNNLLSNIKKLFGIVIPVSPDALPIGFTQEHHSVSESGKKHWR